MPNRIHLAETEIAHTAQMWCAQSEKKSRAESLAENFCRKKQIPTNGYSCSPHNWFVFHRTHSSVHLQFLSAHFRAAACIFPRSNHSQCHGQLSRLSSLRHSHPWKQDQLLNVYTDFREKLHWQRYKEWFHCFEIFCLFYAPDKTRSGRKNAGS